MPAARSRACCGWSTPGGAMSRPPVILLNFSHPLTGEQAAELEAQLRSPVAIRTVPAQFDHALPFAPQVAALADAAGLGPDEWQTAPLLVNLPGYAPAAGCLLAEIHGRSGHFPALLRLSPVADSVPTAYVVSEVIDLAGQRDRARQARQPGAPARGQGTGQDTGGQTRQ